MRLYLIIFSVIPMLAFGQFFENVGEENGLDFSSGISNHGNGVSFFDFDGDGWNDLTFPVSQDSLKIFKNIDGQFSPLPSPFYCSAQAKQVNWVDFDNDGDYDLFVTQYLGNCALLKNTDGVFVNISQTAGIPAFLNAPTFGASWADYDKDGFLDVYICNYDSALLHENWLLHNNGDGTFEEVGQALGVSNGFAATFQSSWIDYDNDGWADLFVINDKAEPNFLYRNNSNGTFTDISELTELDVVMDAMSITVADYDNNSTLDIYITDEPPHNALFRKGAIGYQDLAFEAGVALDHLSWGAVFIDYDNDLDDDLFINTTSFPNDFKNFFFANTGSTFTDASWLGLDDKSHASYGAAKGDFNRDGFNDLVVSNANGDPQDLYMTPTNDNHSITVSLEGTISNKDATGTWLNSWIDGAEYVEWTMNGENYLSQESQYEIISLGSEESLDSLEIIWPSGLEEVYYDIPAESFIELVEGYSPIIEITEGPGAICEGSTLELQASEGFESYLWSNGDSLADIEISEPGEYWVQVMYNGGLTAYSENFTVAATTSAQIEVVTSDTDCFGGSDGSILVSSDIGIEGIIWSNELADTLITGLTVGGYSFTLIDSIGCAHLDTLFISQPDSLWAEANTEDVSCFSFEDGTVEFIQFGGTGEITWSWEGNDPTMLDSGGYMILGLDENDCEFSVSFEIDEPEALALELTIQHSTGTDGSATISISGGTEPYGVSWSNSSDGIILENLAPGSYSVEVTDSNGCSSSQDFVIDQIISVNELDFELNVYPNPASSFLNIQLGDYSSEANYALHTNTGRIIDQGEIRQPFVLDVKEMAPGTYYLWIHFESHSFIRIISIQD